MSITQATQTAVFCDSSPSRPRQTDTLMRHLCWLPLWDPGTGPRPGLAVPASQVQRVWLSSVEEEWPVLSLSLASIFVQLIEQTFSSLLKVSSPLGRDTLGMAASGQCKSDFWVGGFSALIGSSLVIAS